MGVGMLVLSAWASALSTGPHQESGGECAPGATWMAQQDPRHPGDVLWRGVQEDPSGALVRITKSLGPTGRIESTWQRPDGPTLTRAEFLSEVARFPRGPMGRSLQQRLRVARETEPVTVLIELETQPLRTICRHLKQRSAARVLALADQFRAAGPLQRSQISESYDALTHRLRREVAERVTRATAPERESLARWIRGVGGQVAPAPRTFALLSARLDARFVASLAQRPEVRGLDLAPALGGQLDVSVPSLGASAFWNNGYQGGASAFDPGILDTGVDAVHPAFKGLAVNFNIDHYWASQASDYADSWTNPDDYHGHGTASIGILASRGSATWTSHVGMAPGLSSRLYNLKSAYRTTSGAASVFLADAIDNIDWGISGSAVDDIDLLNFSYGITTGSDDSSLSRFMDALVDDLDIPVVVAAGNGGPTGSSLVDPAIAYNVLSVGSMNDIGTTDRADDLISYSSSRGPTPGGRRKPDVIAPGAYITTTNAFWETQLDFGTWSGTSFAAPHVTGAVLLTMDYLGPPVQPKRVKAILINSADKWGSINWNSTYGWGYLDLQDAWSRRQDSFIRNVAPRGQSGDFDLFRATISPFADYATLVWNRHVDYAWGGNYPNIWYGLNDLDLLLYDHQTGALLDVSASAIDNVEQVQHVPGAPVECVIRVEAADTWFSAVSLEEYALAGPPGLTFPSALPQLRPSISAPKKVQKAQRYAVRVLISNPGGFNAITPTLTLSVPAGHTIVKGANPRGLDTLAAYGNTGFWNRRQIHVWEVQAPASTGQGTLKVSAASTCWGETWTGSDSRVIVVTP